MALDTCRMSPDHVAGLMSRVVMDAQMIREPVDILPLVNEGDSSLRSEGFLLRGRLPRPGGLP
ncbi:hypothetical protein, partial [Streptomyces sp. 900116325]